MESHVCYPLLQEGPGGVRRTLRPPRMVAVEVPSQDDWQLTAQAGDKKLCGYLGWWGSIDRADQKTWSAQMKLRVDLLGRALYIQRPEGLVRQRRADVDCYPAAAGRSWERYCAVAGQGEG